MYNTHELSDLRQEIKQILYHIWKTGEIYLEKPDVASELRNISHYLIIISQVISILDKRLINACNDQGFSENEISENYAFPKIRFGNWVGGDRDGHPGNEYRHAGYITSTKTECICVIRRKLLNLVKKLSFAHSLEASSATLKSRVIEIKGKLTGYGEEVLLGKGGGF